MSKRYPIYDLDQHECIRESMEQIKADVRAILRVEGKVKVITKNRSIDVIQSDGSIWLAGCCDRERDDQGRHHNYAWFEGGLFVTEPRGRSSRRKCPGGFKVVKLEPRPPVHRVELFRHNVNPVFIARVIVEVKSDLELENPNAKPEFIFTINVITLNGIRKDSNQRLTVDLVDGVFYHNGERVDASNNEEVAAEVMAKIAALSN